MKYCIILLSSYIILSCNTAEAQNTKVLNQTTYAQEVAKKNIILIDVRTPEEFGNGHLIGAQNINFMDDNFENNIQAIDKDQPVFIYCQSGKRSA